MINKRGSSTVMLAMVFVTFAVCIAGAIGISRRIAVRTECEAYGRMWTRAVLSEYDRHLLEDYSIMAYFGNEAEVIRKIDSYMDYSVSGSLNARVSGSESDLAGYELGEPDNFREAMRLGTAVQAAGALLRGGGRSPRGDSGGSAAESASGASGNSGDGDGAEPPAGRSGKASGRSIGNPVVIDTLPSGGMKTSLSNDSLIEKYKSYGSRDGLSKSITGAGTEMLYIYKYFGNNVTMADGLGPDRSYFRNEWEYIIKGSLSDDENLRACRTRLFVIRNALNLAALYKDPSKVEMITAVAELITPGPLGAATQLIIAEAWAALETEEDLKALYDGDRVPVMKAEGQWKTGLESVISSDKVRKKLDEESRQLLDENSSEIRKITGHDNGNVIRDGLDYDDYLMIMMLSVNERVRLLRIMDLVQINMKYRYYRDFNLMEYFTGVRFSITADGRDYVFEDHYQ